MTCSSYIYFVQAKVKALHAASEVQFDGEEQLSSLYIFLCVAFFHCCYRFGGGHNEKVTAFLKEQLAEKYKDQYSARLIHS